MMKRRKKGSRVGRTSTGRLKKGYTIKGGRVVKARSRKKRRR